MQAQLVIVTIGLVGGSALLSRTLLRLVSDWRYRRLVKDRLERMTLDTRIKSAVG
jgi:hypothetical protein